MSPKQAVILREATKGTVRPHQPGQAVFRAILPEEIEWKPFAEVRAYGVLDEHGRPIIDPARNMKMPEQGAATSVWCATSRQLERLGGIYCEDCDIAVPVPGDSTELRGVRPWAIDREFAHQLRSLS